ncbi:MAG: tetratricopeptide repeat protein [Spirochaetaceae bacterium]|jgi:hypothetical protein|nr:tetratricopeptide repeat protein [Spirochaetaceae bacterium]
MKNDPVIAKSLRLLSRKKYTAAIRLLESEAVRYHDSFRYYYILAVACLFSGDYGGAFTYFISARKLKKRDSRVLLGLAALYLRRGDTVQAVEIYLQVQEAESGNRTAKKALDLIRHSGNSADMNAWIESGKIKKLFPPLPKAPFSLAAALLPVLGALCILAAAAGILLYTGAVPGLKNRQARTGYAETLLLPEERAAPLQPDGTYRYILTRNEAVSAYEKARAFFNCRKDEEAKVEINRIIESNASPDLKNKARLLLSYTETPDFTSLHDSFDYRTVMRDPVLYRDCYVIWEGMAANYTAEDNAAVFDLLVGYDTKKVLQGIVPVRFEHAVDNINTTHPLRVLGRVVPASTDTGINIRLEGMAVHQAALPVP